MANLKFDKKITALLVIDPCNDFIRLTSIGSTISPRRIDV